MKQYKALSQSNVLGPYTWACTFGSGFKSLNYLWPLVLCTLWCMPCVTPVFNKYVENEPDFTYHTVQNQTFTAVFLSVHLEFIGTTQ